jgi:DNA replication protein DnaC
VKETKFWKKQGMNEPMANPHDFFLPGYIGWHPGYETDERRQKACTPDPGCLVCGGVGRLRVDLPYGDPSFGKSVLCSCVEERQRSLHNQQRRQVAQLDAFRDRTFKTFRAELPGLRKAFQTSLTFARNPHGWLFLLGPSGCGKTHLAAAVANQFLDDGAAVFYTTVPDLLDALREALMSSERYTRLFAWAREVELLILDDLGAHQPSAWSNEKLFQLLDFRAVYALPTIITAMVRDLQGLDERLRSRLSDARLVTGVIFEQVGDYRPRNTVRERARES